MSSSSSSISLDDAGQEESNTTSIRSTAMATSTAAAVVLKGYLYNHFTKDVMAELPLNPEAQTTLLSSTGNPLTASVIFHQPDSQDGGKKKEKKKLPFFWIEERQVSDNIPAVVKAMQENRIHMLRMRKEDLKAVENDLAVIDKELEEGNDERADDFAKLKAVAGRHKKEIKNLEQGLVEVKFKEFSVVSSVELPAGSASKLEWFEEPVLWCPTIAKQNEQQGNKDCTAMFNLDKDYVAEEDRDTFILGDGQLYAVGGCNEAQLSSVERYDSKKHCWRKVTSMGSKRQNVGVAVYGGCLYAVGGYDGSSRLSSVERYDSTTNRWEYVASLGSARVAAGVAVCGGYLYVVGGRADSGRLSSVERYDNKTNRWEEVTSMGTVRSGAGVAVYGGYLYAAGGYDGEKYLSSVERYDGKTNRWEEVASMGSKRFEFGVAVYGGHLYAVGGEGAGVERYDSKTNRWEAVASMGSKRDSVGVAVYGGYLYAAGGYDGEKYFSRVERYDGKTNRWEEVASMGSKRFELGVAVYKK